jgi:hypothetical protein
MGNVPPALEDVVHRFDLRRAQPRTLDLEGSAKPARSHGYTVIMTVE